MSRQAEFSARNWAALVEAGPAIAVAVAAVAGSPGQSVGELGGFIDFVAEGVVTHEPDSLLGELVHDVNGRLAAGWRPELDDPLVDGLERARIAGAILDTLPDADEAAAVRGWLLTAARRVAERAREGGVLGVGSEQVSRHEVEAIEAISDALGAGEEGG
jgi:hypothetical protein